MPYGSRTPATLLPPTDKRRKHIAAAPAAPLLASPKPPTRQHAQLDGDATALVRPYLIAHESAGVAR
jgi:hypothetical protein